MSEKLSERTKKILIACLLVPVMIWGTVSFFQINSMNTIHFTGKETVVIRWSDLQDPSKNFTQTLTEDEATAVAIVFDGYRYELGNEIPNCAMDEAISITVGDTVFYLAQCGHMMARNVNTNRYLQIKPEDWEFLGSFFAKYGGHI